MRGDPRWSELAAGIDKPHDQHGKGAWEIISKQRLHRLSGKALHPLLRPSAAAEFGRTMHPEQGLWLSTPFPPWLERALFH